MKQGLHIAREITVSDRWFHDTHTSVESCIYYMDCYLHARQR